MNILLVRLRLIGDVVFTTPIVRALRRHYPGARLSYLVESPAAPVLRHSPHLTDLIVIPRRRGLQRVLDDLSVARDLRRRRFDLAIDLHGGPRAAWLTWASGARRRVGYAMPGRTWLYTDTIKRAPDLSDRHSVENQWDLLSALGIGAPNPVDDAVEMEGDPVAAARVNERLGALGISSAHALIVLHVSAGNPFRRWPEGSFTSLVAGLAAASPARRIVLSSGPSDRRAAERIARTARQSLGEAADRVVEFGEFDLAELRALVARSRLFVGGDTGPLHIAATTNTPIVGIYGPTEPARSAPWRDPRWPTASVEITGLPCRPCDQRVCEPGDFRCLTTLKPDDVLSAAARAMTARR